MNHYVYTPVVLLPTHGDYMLSGIFTLASLRFVNFFNDMCPSLFIEVTSNVFLAKFTGVSCRHFTCITYLNSVNLQTHCLVEWRKRKQSLVFSSLAIGSIKSS